MINYNLLQFCKDRVGLNQLKEYEIELIELYREYQNGVRFKNSRGVLCVQFEGRYIPVEKVEMAFQEIEKRFNEYLKRGYDIEKIESGKDGIYHLGYFEEDASNYNYKPDDFGSGISRKPTEILPLAENTQIIEVYERGLIARDLPSNSSYYFSPEVLGYFLYINKFDIDILNTYARHGKGRPKRGMSVILADGLSVNYMCNNFMEVPTKWKKRNEFGKGYIRLRGNNGRYNFTPLIYEGSSKASCDNEVEVCCEAYVFEQEKAGKDRAYFFNPACSHVNQRHLIEEYIRGEITELGILRDTLTDVAHNPFLVLRYNLIELCRQFCIHIEPFILSHHGVIVNKYGVEYSALASLYCEGKLTREEIHTQYNIRDIKDLSCNQ